MLASCMHAQYPFIPISLPSRGTSSVTRPAARVCVREGVGGPRLIGSPLTLPPRTHEVTYLDWPFLFGRELGGCPKLLSTFPLLVLWAGEDR